MLNFNHTHFNNLKLAQKFTILLLSVFMAGIIFCGVALSALLNHSATAQVTSEAQALFKMVNSLRAYTDTQVKPELDKRLDTEFLPQAVPSYSAREVFETFRQDPAWNQFLYKEATLNPTNLRDKADAFETEIIERFRNDKNLQEVQGFQKTSFGKLFYISRPLTINQASCLECHSTPDKAPKSMLERYGTTNGFGWKLNEVIGAQMMFVPASTVEARIHQSKLITIAIILITFALTLYCVNLGLKRWVVKPLKQMANVAEDISTGNMNAEFYPASQDEVGILAKAFARMRTSLVLAMQRLEQYRKL